MKYLLMSLLLISLSGCATTSAVLRGMGQAAQKKRLNCQTYSYGYSSDTTCYEN